MTKQATTENTMIKTNLTASAKVLLSKMNSGLTLAVPMMGESSYILYTEDGDIAGRIQPKTVWTLEAAGRITGLFMPTFGNDFAVVYDDAEQHDLIASQRDWAEMMDKKTEKPSELDRTSWADFKATAAIIKKVQGL